MVPPTGRTDHSPVARTLGDQLRSALPEASIITEEDQMISYRRDHAPWAAAGTPAAVALVRSTDEVSALLRIASKTNTPVVPRGAGSGLAGGSNAIDGAITLSLEKMNRILEIDEEDGVAVVEPGVLNQELKAAVAERGLWYPPDPASYEFSSLGGNVATNAGGLCCLRYGVTREYVLGLEVVMADGEVLHTGRRSIKGVAGYDLTALLVGSEGTLGVVTRVTLRLRAPIRQKTTLAAFFDDVYGPAKAALEMRRAGLSPSLLEVMDRTTTVAVDEWKNMGLDRDAAGLLFAQVETAGPSDDAAIEALEACCSTAGATSVFHTVDEREGEQLLTARRLAYPALERLGGALLDDVAVPLGRIPAFLRRTEEVSEKHGLMIGSFGHLGDGNMHPTIVFDPQDESQRARVLAAFEELVMVALDLGGTVTGEHGVGLLKRSFLGVELGDRSRLLHHGLKRLFDPLGILNPGKMLPLEGDRSS